MFSVLSFNFSFPLFISLRLCFFLSTFTLFLLSFYLFSRFSLSLLFSLILSVLPVFPLPFFSAISSAFTVFRILTFSSDLFHFKLYVFSKSRAFLSFQETRSMDTALHTAGSSSPLIALSPLRMKVRLIKTTLWSIYGMLGQVTVQQSWPVTRRNRLKQFLKKEQQKTTQVPWQTSIQNSPFSQTLGKMLLCREQTDKRLKQPHLRKKQT